MSEQGAPTIESVVEKILELRDRAGEYTRKASEAKDVIDRLEVYLLKRMQDAGLTGMAVMTKEGKYNISQKTSTRIGVADWDIVLKYVLDTGNFALLTKSISSREAKHIMDSGDEVPGVNVFSEMSVSVIKSRASK